MATHKVSFSVEGHAPVEVPEGQTLSEELDASNSPLLFGCRSGICGTCISQLDAGDVPPPDEQEQEIIELHAPDNPKARLACQINLTCDITIRPIE